MPRGLLLGGEGGGRGRAIRYFFGEGEEIFSYVCGLKGRWSMKGRGRGEENVIEDFLQERIGKIQVQDYLKKLGFTWISECSPLRTKQTQENASACLPCRRNKKVSKKDLLYETNQLAVSLGARNTANVSEGEGHKFFRENPPSPIQKKGKPRRKPI